MDTAMVEGPVEKISRKEVTEAIRKMKQGRYGVVGPQGGCCYG